MNIFRKKIGDFICFPYKLEIEDSAQRCLYVKRHEGNNDTKPSDRTLYVLNIPQYLTKKCMDFLFKDYGDIERIYMHKKPKSEEEVSPGKSRYFSDREPKLGCKVAYVVFKKPSCVKNVLKLKNGEIKTIPFAKIRVHVGKVKWIREYNAQFIDQDALKREIDSYMCEYDKREEEEKQKAKEMDGVPDEEGWITVTKHSKKPKIPRSEAISKKIIEKQNKERAKKRLLSFYKHQLQETKMEQIAELRKKFEKDKELISMMKANRKFKPF